MLQQPGGCVALGLGAVGTAPQRAHARAQGAKLWPGGRGPSGGEGERGEAGRGGGGLGLGECEGLTVGLLHYVNEANSYDKVPWL